MIWNSRKRLELTKEPVSEGFFLSYPLIEFLSSSVFFLISK